MSKELDTIKQKIAENKEYLRETYGVEEIGVFGSYVHGDYKPESDVDVVVEFNENSKTSLFDYMDIQHYLEKKLNKKVDLVTKSGIRPAFRKYILPTIVYI